MKFLITMFSNEQERDTAEEMHQEGIQRYEKEGLIATHLHNEIIKIDSLYKSDMKNATVKGVLIGAAACCLIGVGVLGYKKISNRRKKKKSEEKEA